jgi:DNA-binding GntR family transcriptional regulator
MIDREGPTPVYVQVADVIAARIAEGTYVANRPIPSEIRLQQEFGVARDTVRAAVGLLRTRGLVFTVRGKGTYVGAAPDLE